MIPAADIPKLVFTPANRSADYMATIGYTVTDDSGTAATNTSAAAVLTITVDADQDGPALTSVGESLKANGRSVAHQTTLIAGDLPEPADLFEAVDEGDTVSYSLPTSGVTPANPSWLVLTSGSFVGSVVPERTSVAATQSYMVTLRATADSVDTDLAFTITVTMGLVAVADAIAMNESDTSVNMTTDGGNILGNDTGRGRTVVGYNMGTTYSSTAVSHTAAGTGLAGANGTLNIAVNGDFTYTPLASRASAINGLLAGAEISDVFSYGITDAANGNSSATITVTITGENDKPTAMDTSLAAVDEDATHSFAAISNSMPGGDFSFMDVDVTSDSGPDVLTSVTITALPALGALALDGTAVTVGQVIPVADFSKLVFTPANLSAATHDATIGYTVTDFSSATDGTATSDEATLTIPVTGGEDAPARTAAGTALNGSAQSLAVGGNASSLPHPNTLFVAVDEDDMVADGVAYGIVVRNAADAPATWLMLGTDGSFEGTVPPLADSASYTVTLTATADTEMATLSFTIGVAQGPAPVADEITVMEGATAVTMTAASQSSIFANDLGLEDMGDTRSLDGYVVGNTYPSDGTTNVLAAGANAVGTYGTLVINANGSFTYTLDNTAGGATDMLGAGDEEEDVFTYRVSDGQATTMAANATVTVTVQGVNDAPVYTASTFTDSDIVEMGLNVGGDSMGAGNFTGTDVDGDTLGAQVQNPDDMSWGATAKGKFGTLTIAGTAWTYELDDADDDTNSLAAGDTALGESFMVRLTDGNGGESAAAALAITTIMGSNDAPALATGQNEYPDTVIMPGMAMSAIAGGRYADPESGTTLTYTVACADAVTTATLCGAGGALPAWVAFDTTDGSFGPVTGQTVPDPFNGTMNITVTIADSEGGSVMDTFAITHRDLDPVANADPLTITEGGNDLTGNVYDNDTGVRGHPMDVTTLAGYSTGATFNAGSATTDHSALRGAYGSLTIMNDGAYTYSLDNTAGSAADMLAGGQMVMDVFTYRVSDKAAGTPSGDGVITVTITGVNDAPVEVADILPSAIDGTQSVALVATVLPDFDTAFSDSDGDTLTITAVASGLPAGLTYTAATRTLSGTPTATGAGTITVTATDGSGGTATVTIDVRVSARPGTGTTITPPMMTRTGDNMMMVAVTDPEAEVDSDENAADHGVRLTATAFGYQDMDARLASVTITTLPTPTSGRLVLVQRNEAGMGTGEAPVTENQTITRADLDAGNLVIVSNTSNGATVSFTFTTTGTEGNEATAIDADRPIGERTSTTMIGGKESMPEVLTRMLTRTGADGMPTMETVIGVGDQPAYVGRDFSYTIRLVDQTGQLDGVDVVWTNDDPSAVATPTAADIDPGDYDQDLTITITSATCAATVAEGCTMGASAIGVDGWLEVRKVDGVPGMSTASYTLRNKRDLVLSDFGDYTVALSITDGTTVITDTFTLQVNRLPMYNITNVVHDKEKRLITFTVTSENGVVIDQTMMVDVQSDANYVANKPVGVKFGANGSTATSMPGSIPIIRFVGPSDTVRLSVAMSDEWEQWFNPE